MAITSANYEHGNTIRYLGNNICQQRNQNNNSVTPFGTTYIKSGIINSHINKWQ